MPSMTSIVVPPGFYSSSDWRRARSRALARDGGRCTHVARDGTRCAVTDRLQVHHLTAMVDGGDWYALDNLETRCRAHHRERRRGTAMRLELSIEEWWAAVELAGSAPAVPGWVSGLVREATRDEVARQRRVVEERNERWRRENPEQADFLAQVIHLFASEAGAQPQARPRRRAISATRANLD